MNLSEPVTSTLVLFSIRHLYKKTLQNAGSFESAVESVNDQVIVSRNRPKFLKEFDNEWPVLLLRRPELDEQVPVILFRVEAIALHEWTCCSGDFGKRGAQKLRVVRDKLHCRIPNSSRNVVDLSRLLSCISLFQTGFYTISPGRFVYEHHGRKDTPTTTSRISKSVTQALTARA